MYIKKNWGDKGVVAEKSNAYLKKQKKNN